LVQAPVTLVLSACESGLSDVRPGDELMGLAAALFALGTTTVVGSVIAVPDAETVPLMSAFHRHLALGESASTALARAQVEVSGGSSSPLHAVGGFISVGGG
jgi:CHAT domain-containing protein